MTILQFAKLCESVLYVDCISSALGLFWMRVNLVWTMRFFREVGNGVLIIVYGGIDSVNNCSNMRYMISHGWMVGDGRHIFYMIVEQPSV